MNRGCSMHFYFHSVLKASRGHKVQTLLWLYAAEMHRFKDVKHLTISLVWSPNFCQSLWWAAVCQIANILDWSEQRDDPSQENYIYQVIKKCPKNVFYCLIKYKWSLMPFFCFLMRSNLWNIRVSHLLFVLSKEDIFRLFIYCMAFLSL